MPAVVGSFQAELMYDNRRYCGWVDVQPSLGTPLLSWEHCRELGVVPRAFPKQIPEAQHTSSRVCGAWSGTLGKDTTTGPTGTSTTTPSLSMSTPLPFTDKISPSAAKEYFIKKYLDMLVTKEALQTAPLISAAGPPMRTHLREDTQSFTIHMPWVIPLTFQEAVKKEVDSMVAQGITTPVGNDPSPWCHPLVTMLRLTVGYALPPTYRS